MFKAGQKVVCVDDIFPEGIKQFYWKLPVAGVTYTIRELTPGISHEKPDSRDPMDLEVAVYLVELINPCSDKEPYPERGFKAERFRPLDTETETNEQFDDVPHEMPAEYAV